MAHLGRVSYPGLPGTECHAVTVPPTLPLVPLGAALVEL